MINLDTRPYPRQIPHGLPSAKYKYNNYGNLPVINEWRPQGQPAKNPITIKLLLSNCIVKLYMQNPTTNTLFSANWD